MNSFLLAAVFTLTSGCAALQYKGTTPGVIEGDLDVKWIDNDCFLYVPDANNPLRFTRGKKATPQIIKPTRRMYTDGGSIPRVLWALPQFSPWGYAPGYIIHDWLFEAHHCQIQGQDVPFPDSAQILAEAIKTQMESNPAVKSELAEYLIYSAVKSSIAEDLWTHGSCHSPENTQMLNLLSNDSLNQFSTVMRIHNGKAVPTGPIEFRRTSGLNSVESNAAIAAIERVCGSPAPQ